MPHDLDSRLRELRMARGNGKRVIAAQDQELCVRTASLMARKYSKLRMLGAGIPERPDEQELG
jgi:hypothetical protein